MDDKLRGRKVKVVVDEIVKDTIRMGERECRKLTSASPLIADIDTLTRDVR